MSPQLNGTGGMFSSPSSIPGNDWLIQFQGRNSNTSTVSARKLARESFHPAGAKARHDVVAGGPGGTGWRISQHDLDSTRVVRVTILHLKRYKLQVNPDGKKSPIHVALQLVTSRHPVKVWGATQQAHLHSWSQAHSFQKQLRRTSRDGSARGLPSCRMARVVSSRVYWRAS